MRSRRAPAGRRGRPGMLGLGVAALATAAIAVPAVAVSSTTHAQRAVASTSQIVFASTRPAADGTTDAEIYVMNYDGTGVTQLTNNTSITTTDETTGEETVTPINDLSPVWSPDRTKIAYLSLGVATSGGGLAGSQLWVMNADGTSPVELTASPASEGANFEPSWSPDSKKIVFRRGDGSTRSHIMVIDVATKAESDLVLNTGKTLGMPAWSPDGRTVLYVYGAGVAADIWSHSLVDGSDKAVIATASLAESNPAWAPDGKTIAYQSGDEGSGASIWIMNADGSSPHQVTTPPAATSTTAAGSDTKPAFGEDGSQIVFQSSRDCDPAVCVPTEEDSEEGGSGGSSTTHGGGGGSTTHGGGGGSTTHGGGGGGDTEDTVTVVLPSNIWVTNIDGTGPGRLTQAPTTEVLYATYADTSPDWSSPSGPGYTPGQDSGGGSTPPPSTDTGSTGSSGGGGGGGAATTQGEQGKAPAETGKEAAKQGAFLPPDVPNAKACTIVGSEGDDTIHGTSGADVICALGGNDVVYGMGGNDTVYAGDGNDTVILGIGNSTVYGGAGNDKLLGGTGNDVMWGNEGDDVVNGAAGNDYVNGGSGDDTLLAGTGRDRLYGADGDDALVARDSAKGDWVNGGSGTDKARLDGSLDGTYDLEGSF